MNKNQASKTVSLCPFCKEEPLIIPIKLKSWSSFEFWPTDRLLRVYCPRCKRRVIEISGKLFIEMEERNE